MISLLLGSLVSTQINKLTKEIQIMLENFNIIEDKENLCYQVRTKNTLYSLELDDKEKENIFLSIVKEIKKKSGIPLKNLIKKVGKNNDHSKVIDVLQTLSNNGLLSFEHSQEIQSNKNESMSQHPYADYKPIIPEKALTILSNNTFGTKIMELAKSLSFKEVHLAPFHQKMDIEALIKDTDFVIVNASEWSPFHLEELNRIALLRNLPWLYIGGVEEMSMKIGPLFYGKETGCYNCLISRIKSNHEYPAFLTDYENYLRKRKIPSKPDIVINSELFNNIIANYAMIEVTNFFQPWSSLPSTWKTVMSIDLRGFDTNKHELLKKPFCEVCKPELQYNATPWLEAVTLS